MKLQTVTSQKFHNTPMLSLISNNDGECNCCNGNKPCKIKNIHRHASGNDLTQEEKACFLSHNITQLETVVSQFCFSDILKMSLKFCANL